MTRRAFSHDITAAILVFLNNEMFVPWENDSFSCLGTPISLSRKRFMIELIFI